MNWSKKIQNYYQSEELYFKITKRSIKTRNWGYKRLSVEEHCEFVIPKV